MKIFERRVDRMKEFYTENLSINYNNNYIIKNLNFEIPLNKISVIIGSNGCGKSTLLKALTRIISNYSGSIILDGKEILKENTKLLAKKMAILPQSQEIITGLSVFDLVSYGRFPYQNNFGSLTKKDLDIINRALKATGTYDFKNKRVEALSGGQRQRVWIALALAQETPVIFLDEPTTYLDMAHQLEILELLKNLNKEQGKTIIMVLHDINQAARFADYIIAMKKGQIIKKGNPWEVIETNCIKEIFNIEAFIQEDSITKLPVCVSYNLIRKEKNNEKNNEEQNKENLIFDKLNIYTNLGRV